MTTIYRQNPTNAEHIGFAYKTDSWQTEYAPSATYGTIHDAESRGYEALQSLIKSDHLGKDEAVLQLYKVYRHIEGYMIYHAIRP